MKINDKVKLSWKPNGKEVFGYIKQIIPNKDASFDYLVKYDGDFIPTEDWHKRNELNILRPNNTVTLPAGFIVIDKATLKEHSSTESACQCGAAHDRHFPSQHMSFCPLFIKYY